MLGNHTVAQYNLRNAATENENYEVGNYIMLITSFQRFLITLCFITSFHLVASSLILSTC